MSKAELVVEDDGVGRAEGAPAKGTGLGTRIVTAMAHSLGGTIEYEQRSPGMLARVMFAAADVGHSAGAVDARDQTWNGPAPSTTRWATGGRGEQCADFRRDGACQVRLTLAARWRWFARRSSPWRRTDRRGSPRRRCLPPFNPDAPACTPSPGSDQVAGLRAGERPGLPRGRQPRPVALAAKDRGLDYQRALADSDAAKAKQQMQTFLDAKVGALVATSSDPAALRASLLQAIWAGRLRRHHRAAAGDHCCSTHRNTHRQGADRRGDRLHPRPSSAAKPTWCC